MGQYQNVPGPSQDEFDAQTQAIANLNSNMTKYSFASAVEITSSAMSSDGYTIPDDGYIVVYQVGGANDFYYLTINGVFASANFAQGNSSSVPSGVYRFAQFIFVRKGMVIKGSGNHWGSIYYKLQ